MSIDLTIERHVASITINRPDRMNAMDAEHYAGHPHYRGWARITGILESIGRPILSFQPVVPTRWLDDGDTVAVGELTLNVIHCPGHTPGHVVFHHPETSFAFVGDVLFAGSIGRTDFPQGNHQHLIDSITQRLWPMGDDTVFIPGHGPESTFGRERKTNPYVGGT